MPTFDPVSWQPLPAPPLTGEFESNTRLASAQLIEIGREGPEDVIVDDDGKIYAGTADGSIIRIAPDGSAVDLVANVGERPLGLEWYGDDIIVCNAERGLKKVELNGTVETLATSFEGIDFMLVNNATVASDGTIYFTDTSTRWTMSENITDLLEGQTTGRLFSLSADGSLALLQDGIQFANGVALDGSGSSIFVAETGHYRVHRYWLTGDRAGEFELFLDNLPGFPDNLSFANETLWVSIVSPRQTMIDIMMPRPWLRSMANRMPERLKPKAVRHGMILGYDQHGSITHNLQDSTGKVATTTSARLHGGSLYLGSLTDSHIAVYPL